MRSDRGGERSRNRQLRGDDGGTDTHGGVAESTAGRVGGIRKHRSVLDCPARGAGRARFASAAGGYTATGAGARAGQKDRPDGLRVDSAAAQLRITAGFVSTGGSSLHAADAGAGEGQPGGGVWRLVTEDAKEPRPDERARASGSFRHRWGDGDGHSACHRGRRTGCPKTGQAARPTLQQNRTGNCRTIAWALAGGSLVQLAAGSEDVRRGAGADRRV